MSKERPTEKVALPQANPGNVMKALDGIQYVGREQAISIEWLKKRGISQPKAVLSMLKWLAVLDSTSRLDQSLADCRESDSLLAEKLRQCVIRAYTAAGCGGGLEWFGKPGITGQDIRKLISDKPPFTGHDLKSGGHKNAFYCLCALHDWLLNKIGGTQGQSDSPVATESVLQDISEEKTTDQQIAAPLSGSEVPHSDDCIRVPFTFDANGEPVWARIYVEGTLKPGYVAKLSQMLQKAMEELGDSGI